MSSEPLFDPSLKKKKKVKKAVAFDELDAELDAAPTEQAEAAEDEGEKETKKVQVDTKDEIDLALPADKDGSLTLKEEEPLDFSDLKKKKKKKPIAVDLEEVATPSAEPAEDTGAAVPKRDALGNTVEDESVAEEPTATAATSAVDAEFGDLKKKKKKAKKSAMDLEAFERELAGETGSGTATPSLKTTGEDGEVPDGSANPDLDLEPEGENVFEQGVDEGASSSLSKALQAAEKKTWMQPGQEGRDYEYIELLGRFYMQLYASHPSLNPSAGTGKKRFVIQPPSMHRDGNKRSVFANIAEICRKMHRQPEHVIPFIFAELGTTGSVDGSGRLVIKGRFQQKQIENVLRRYILEYVTCKTCKSPDTLLNKENRIYFLDCQTCQSRSSVSAISAGFKAQVGRRKAQQTG